MKKYHEGGKHQAMSDAVSMHFGYKTYERPTRKGAPKSNDGKGVNYAPKRDAGHKV